jgi:signal transduction histidine kinase
VLRPKARSLRLGRLPLAALVVTLAVTVGGFVLAQRWVDRSERDALERAASNAASFVSSYARQVEAILFAGSAIADATAGESETFERALSERVRGTAITSITLLRRSGGSFEPVVTAGAREPLLLAGLTAADERRLETIVRTQGEIRVVKIARGPVGAVIGFATAADEAGRFAVYAETTMPVVNRLFLVQLPEGLEYATYVDRVSEETLVRSTSDVLPIPGETVERQIRVGNGRAVIVVGGGGDAVSTLTEAIPWLILGFGIVASVVLALVLELTRRRRLAEAGQESLVEQNAQLRELDRLKDELVATVSHELRTPLTSILGYLELIREEPDTISDEQRSFLDVVERNARRLLNLVSDLLFVARIDAGRLDLDVTEVELGAVAAECVEAQRPRAERADVTLALELDEHVPAILGDRTRLVQLLDNLLSNAIKFTPAGGRVDVRVGQRDGGVALEVADTGMGIGSDDQEHLFERFFRTKAAGEAAIQGTGLGLTIVKAIVDAHGGTISVESAEGAGTTFRVLLPTRLADPGGRPKEARVPDAVA